MTPELQAQVTHRFWCRAYRALLALLPHGMRTRHGDAMLALFDRELERRASDGTRAVWTAGLAGLADLLVRGMHERLSDERRALTPPTVVVLRHTVRAFLVTSVVLTAVLVSKSALTRATLPVSGTASDAVLFSIPYTAALTIPMSVFIAVLWATSRRPSGAPSDEASGGVRFAPVIGMASAVALCCLALKRRARSSREPALAGDVHRPDRGVAERPQYGRCSSCVRRRRRCAPNRTPHRRRAPTAPRSRATRSRSRRSSRWPPPVWS